MTQIEINCDWFQFSSVKIPEIKDSSQETPLPCHSYWSHLKDHTKIFNYLVVLFTPTVTKEKKSMSRQEHLGFRSKSIIQLVDVK